MRAGLMLAGPCAGSLPIRVSPSKTPVKVDSKEDREHSSSSSNVVAGVAPAGSAGGGGPLTLAAGLDDVQEEATAGEEEVGVAAAPAPAPAPV